MGELAALAWSTNRRRPLPSKKAMPQPSAWWSVLPPRWQKPVKLNEASVGVAQLRPRS